MYSYFSFTPRLLPIWLQESLFCDTLLIKDASSICQIHSLVHLIWSLCYSWSTFMKLSSSGFWENILSSYSCSFSVCFPTVICLSSPLSCCIFPCGHTPPGVWLQLSLCVDHFQICFQSRPFSWSPDSHIQLSSFRYSITISTIQNQTDFPHTCSSLVHLNASNFIHSQLTNPGTIIDFSFPDSPHQLIFKSHRFCVHACQVPLVISYSLRPYRLACQASRSVGFSWQEYWSGLPLGEAMLAPRGSSWARDKTFVSYISALAGRFFTTSAIWEAHSF